MSPKRRRRFGVHLPPNHPPQHRHVNASFSIFNASLNLPSLANLCSFPSLPTMASLSRLLPTHRYTSSPLPSSDLTPKLSLVGFPSSAPSGRAVVSVARWLRRKDHAQRGSLMYIFDAFLLVVVLFLAGGLICGFSFVCVMGGNV